MLDITPQPPFAVAKGATRKLALVGGFTVLFSLTVFTSGAMGLMPTGLSTSLVIVGMGVTLRTLWSYTAKLGGSTSRDRISTWVSNVGLALSTLTVITALPRLTQSSSTTSLAMDFLAQLWTLTLLMVAAGPARTLGWRTFAGAFLFGFLGLGALARFIGRPVVLELGTRSVFAVGTWVPVTEELVKLLPLLVILMVTRRRVTGRPSVFDLVLVSSWAAAGFAINENAGYGRGKFSIGGHWLSIVYPSAGKAIVFGWNLVQTGHLVHTALIALAIGVAVLYRRPARKLWMFPAVAIAAVLLEHCSQNWLFVGGLNRFVAYGTLILTLGGRLCMLLLIGGVGYLMALEWRVVGMMGTLRDCAVPASAEQTRRAALFARAQLTVIRAEPTSAAAVTP